MTERLCEKKTLNPENGPGLKLEKYRKRATMMRDIDIYGGRRRQFPYHINNYLQSREGDALKS